MLDGVGGTGEARLGEEGSQHSVGGRLSGLPGGLQGNGGTDGTAGPDADCREEQIAAEIDNPSSRDGRTSSSRRTQSRPTGGTDHLSDEQTQFAPGQDRRSQSGAGTRAGDGDGERSTDDRSGEIHKIGMVFRKGSGTQAGSQHRGIGQQIHTKRG